MEASNAGCKAICEALPQLIYRGADKELLLDASSRSPHENHQRQSADEVEKELNAAVDRDPRLNLIRQMLKFLIGEKIRVIDVAEPHASLEQS